MSTQEFADRLCKVLCELDSLVKEYLFGKRHDCGIGCSADKES